MVATQKTHTHKVTPMSKGFTIVHKKYLLVAYFVLKQLDNSRNAHTTQRNQL
jgi:hypothetical protein